MEATTSHPGSILSLREKLLTGEITLTSVVDNIYDTAAKYQDYNIWIHLQPKEVILEKIKLLKEVRYKSALPLYGIPFSVKDNIDVVGIPTTAACKEFSYIPAASAHVVELLENAGAIMIGKTNLDQFATGLVGTRSPYGIVKNSYNTAYIAGGSSSGSAVSVALGIVQFSLGTDTAGSGRIPAGFNNIIGVKPTKSTISTKGVVPACKSLDCVSVFCKSCDDAALIMDIISDKKNAIDYAKVGSNFTFAVPEKKYLDFKGNTEYERLFNIALDKLVEQGGKMVHMDFLPFMETAKLLYEGPWVAERIAGIKTFFENNKHTLLPEIKTIFEGAASYSAVDTFSSLHRLDDLKNKVDQLLLGTDFLFVPTAPTIYKIAEVLAEPILLNKNLGYYTNFVNLLGLCALAVPNGFTNEGLPMGVTLIGKQSEDKKLLYYGKIFLHPDLNNGRKEY